MKSLSSLLEDIRLDQEAGRLRGQKNFGKELLPCLVAPRKYQKQIEVMP